MGCVAFCEVTHAGDGVPQPSGSPLSVARTWMVALPSAQVSMISSRVGLMVAVATSGLLVVAIQSMSTGAVSTSETLSSKVVDEDAPTTSVRLTGRPASTGASLTGLTSIAAVAVLLTVSAVSVAW